MILGARLSRGGARPACFYAIYIVVLTEPIDAIVNLAGPTLPEEDLEYLRRIWISEGVNAQRVGEVLVDSLCDLVGGEAFPKDLETAWNVAVITIIRDW